MPGVGRLLCVTTPAGFERFFRSLAEAARSGEPPETAYARASEGPASPGSAEHDAAQRMKPVPAA